MWKPVRFVYVEISPARLVIVVMGCDSISTEPLAVQSLGPYCIPHRKSEDTTLKNFGSWLRWRSTRKTGRRAFEHSGRAPASTIPPSVLRKCAANKAASILCNQPCRTPRLKFLFLWLWNKYGASSVFMHLLARTLNHQTKKIEGN